MTTMLLPILAAAALAAQTSTTQVEPQRATAGPNHVTVVGCIERADQVIQPGTTGSTVDSLDFVLIKAADAKDAAAATGTTGTTGATAKGDLRMYRLDAATEKLNPHVGHKVEVTGIVSGPATADSTAPKLKVEEVKMVSSTCQR